MAVFVPSTILLVASLFLIVPSPVAVVSATYTNVSPCGELVVRALLNDGIVTATKYCERMDAEKLTDAIQTVFEPYFSSPETRRLRSTGGKGRRQLTHCPHLCIPTLPEYVCLSNAPQCVSWWRQQQNNRRLHEVSVINLDDIFYGTFGNGGGDRELTDNTCGFTVEQCEYEKILFLNTLRSKASVVNDECANLLNSPMKLDCLLVVPHTLAPVMAPAPEPARAPTKLNW